MSAINEGSKPIYFDERDHRFYKDKVRLTGRDVVAYIQNQASPDEVRKIGHYVKNMVGHGSPKAVYEIRKAVSAYFREDPKKVIAAHIRDFRNGCLPGIHREILRESAKKLMAGGGEARAEVARLEGALNELKGKGLQFKMTKIEEVGDELQSSEVWLDLDPEIDDFVNWLKSLKT